MASSDNITGALQLTEIKKRFRNRFKTGDIVEVPGYIPARIGQYSDSLIARIIDIGENIVTIEWMKRDPKTDSIVPDNHFRNGIQYIDAIQFRPYKK